MHVYYCKHCQKPIEQSIEGELVCEACWCGQTERDKKIAWYGSHCHECGRELRGGGLCRKCELDLGIRCPICKKVPNDYDMVSFYEDGVKCWCCQECWNSNACAVWVGYPGAVDQNA